MANSCRAPYPRGDERISIRARRWTRAGADYIEGPQCPCGGTGRRARLQNRVPQGVWVRFPPRAPIEKFGYDFVSFFRKGPTQLFGGTQLCAALFLRFEQMHCGFRQSFLIGGARVYFRHLERIPPKNCQELMRRRAAVGRDSSARFPQPMSHRRKWRLPSSITFMGE